MRPKLFILFLFITSVSFSQQSYTIEQINRLADAGKVWGYLKYYHPFLQYKNINWDSAFSATVPKILEARNKKEYEYCIQNLLNNLNDPVTTVIHIPKPTKPIHYSELVISDSVMIISRDDYRAIIDEDTAHRLFAKAIKQFGKANSVIFDLRPDPETAFLNEASLQEIFDDTEILTNLFSGILLSPGIRSVYHNAFLGEQSSDNVDYQSHFLIERKHFLIGTATKNIPIAFIINRYSELPLDAITLQLAGKAVIIQEKGAGETGSVPDKTFWIADSLLLRVRTGEIINSDNGLGYRPDIIIEQSEDRSIAIDKAKEILKSRNKPINNIKIEFEGFNSKYTGQKYTDQNYPSIGDRTLAAAKIYTVLKYFYPNKDLWTHNWDSLYIQFLPRFLLAKDSLEYVKTVMEYYAYIQDGHGLVIHPLANAVRFGTWGLPAPFLFRITENHLVITHILDDSLASLLNIKRGDIVLERDGVNIIKDLNEKRKIWAASNYDAQSGYIITGYLRDSIGKTTRLKLKDVNGKIKDVMLPRYRLSKEKREKAIALIERGNDKPMLYFITKDIGYVNMGLLATTQVDSMFTMFQNTKAIIFDFRQHPHESARLIAARLTDKNPLYHPGNLPGPALASREDERKGDIYKGKAVCLMYENTQSHGETSVSNMKDGGAILIGNHTAGANGNTEHFFIPGGISLTFTTGKVQEQGKGIQPDILVTPTIKGISLGKDEILDRAIKYLQTGK